MTAIPPDNPFSNLLAREGTYDASGFYHDYPFSNDTVVSPLSIAECMSDDQPGFVVSLGSIGAALSLSSLWLERAVVNVDINPMVIRMSRHVMRIIEDYRYGDIIDILDDSLTGIYSAHEQHGRLGLHYENMRREFSEEVQNYSDLHWTHSRNLGRVKDFITKGGLVPVAADITSPVFSQGVSKIAANTALTCSLLNLTNAHMYWKGPDQIQAALSSLPLSDRTNITFSAYGYSGAHFQLNVVAGIISYLEAIRDEIGSELQYL